MKSCPRCRLELPDDAKQCPCGCAFGDEPDHSVEPNEKVVPTTQPGLGISPETQGCRPGGG